MKCAIEFEYEVNYMKSCASRPVLRKNKNDDCTEYSGLFYNLNQAEIVMYISSYIQVS